MRIKSRHYDQKATMTRKQRVAQIARIIFPGQSRPIRIAPPTKEEWRRILTEGEEVRGKTKEN
jgi:hypothetical protein